MREDLIERLRSEAEISDRPGQMDRLNALADEFAAALEAAREDAERYRWLRDPCSGAERVIFYCRGDYGRGLMSGSMLDAAIDDAMQRTRLTDLCLEEGDACNDHHDF